MTKRSENDEAIKSRDYLLKNKRLSSSSIEDIEDLQNVTSKKEFLPDLIEKAHPDFVVVMNAYDAINGSIFNHKQRQNIIRKLINRPATTQLTNYKLASVELAKVLTSLANTLHTEEGGELSKKADACLISLKDDSEKLTKKKAFIGDLGRGLYRHYRGLSWTTTIGLVAGGIALLYWYNNAEPTESTIEENGTKALDWFNTVLGSGSQSWEYSYNEMFLNLVKRAKLQTLAILGKWKVLSKELQQIEFTADFKKKLATDEAFARRANALLQRVDNFGRAIEPTLQSLSDLSAEINNPQFRNHAVRDRGWTASLLDSANHMFGGFLENGHGTVFSDYLTKMGGAINAFARTCTSQLSYYQQMTKDVGSGVYSDEAKSMFHQEGDSDSDVDDQAKPPVAAKGDEGESESSPDDSQPSAKKQVKTPALSGSDGAPAIETKPQTGLDLSGPPEF